MTAHTSGRHGDVQRPRPARAGRGGTGTRRCRSAAATSGRATAARRAVSAVGAALAPDPRDEHGREQRNADRRAHVDLRVASEEVAEALGDVVVARVRAGGGDDHAGDERPRPRPGRPRPPAARGGGPSPASRSARQSHARSASRVAKARATIESRKCEPTAIGCRPREHRDRRRAASGRRSRRRAAAAQRRIAARGAGHAAGDDPGDDGHDRDDAREQPVGVLDPAREPALAGTTPPSQVGQSGQPSPDAVRRTIAAARHDHPQGGEGDQRQARERDRRPQCAQQASQVPHGGHRSCGRAARPVSRSPDGRVRRPRRPARPPRSPRRPPGGRAAQPVGTALGVAITVIAVVLAVSYGVGRGDDDARIVMEVVDLHELAPDVGGAAPTPPPRHGLRGQRGGRRLGADRDRGRTGSRAVTTTTTFWEQAGQPPGLHDRLRRSGGDPPDRPPDRPRAACCCGASTTDGRTAVTWTENGHTVVISAHRHLAGVPLQPRRRSGAPAASRSG